MVTTTKVRALSLPAIYPPANQTAQARPKLAGGATFDHVEKLVLHTTETAGWPGYPTFAPHLTYNPWTYVWHQHYALTKSATTLADPSSTPVRENRDYAIQVEIVAYCDPKLSAKHGHFIDDIDDRAVRDLADFAAWLHEHAGLQLSLAETWLPYAVSSRGGARNRMTSGQFDAFRGILGHEHASGNDHLDPGAPPWLDKMLAYAKAGTSDTTPAEPEIGPKFMDDVYVNNTGNQPLAPGENSVKINGDGDLSFVTGASKGVDVLATLDIRDAKGRPYYGRVSYNPDYPTDPAEQATTAEPQFILTDRPESFFRVVSYLKGTTTTTVADRRPTSTDQVSFKGAIPADKDAKRSARLRLIVTIPEGVTGLVLRSVQASGWEL